MRYLFAVLFLAPILTLPAVAADLRPAAYKAAPPPVPAFNWTGAYAGLSAGGRWADTSWHTTAIGLPLGAPDPTTTPASFDSATARLGGYIGYN